jgi:hypothetical protein
MRNLLIAASAVALFAGIATQASATGDSYGVQLNLGTLQLGQSNVHRTSVGGKLNLSTAAVGTNLSVLSDIPATTDHTSNSGRTNGDARVASLQVNALTAQIATTSVTRSSVGADLTTSTQAIGNAVDVESTHNYVSNGYVTSNTDFDKSISLQANVGAVQLATTDIARVSVGDDLDVSTIAVGNTSSFFGAKGVAAATGQLNLGTVQLASTDFTRSSVADNASFSTSAFGNVASYTGNTVDPLTVQVNALTIQGASTNIGRSSFGGNVSVDTSAVGNAITVSTNLNN